MTYIMALTDYDRKQWLLAQFDDALIAKIAELAAALTPIRDIAALLDLQENVLRMAINLPDSQVSVAYRKAKAATALKLRQQELELAEVGSPMAVQMTAAYLKDMQADEDL